MLNKLFRPKWQHENPDVRKAAIAKFTSSDADTLNNLALNDDQGDIRQLAISKIEKLEQLENVAANSKTRADQDFAQQCWVSRLIESHSKIELEQWILDCKNEQQLLRIIAFSQDDNLSELALSGMQDDAHLLALLKQSKNAKVWRSIVNKLQQEESLKQALELIKGKDKKTQQQLKARLNALHQQASQQQALQQQAEHFLNKLQKMQEFPQNPQFEGQLLSAQQQWQELKPQLNGNDCSTDIEATLNACQQLFDDELQQQQQAAAEAEKVLQDSSARTTLLEQLQTLLNDICQEQLPQQQQLLSEIQQQWQTLNQGTPSSNQPLFEKRCQAVTQLINAHQRLQQLPLEDAPQAPEKQSYQALQKKQKQLKKLQEKLNWPDSADIPKPLQQINEQAEALEQQLKQLDQEADSLVHQIRDWITQADELIDSDDLKQAKTLANKIRPALGKLPEHKSKSFAAAFQRISHAVRSLEQWKDFATDPKRESLCEQMQKLIDTDIPAPNKADAIKALQKDWKALGYCHNQDLWQRFQALADEAYLPCKAFYADQKKQRSYNAEQRTIICQQLEDFILHQDWQHCDWKALDKLHKASQQEWQRFSPVAKEKHKALQDRFYTALNQIRDKLNEERQRNTDAMQALVQQALALADNDNIQQAIEDYQGLHQQWKKLGISFHKQQHQLWQQMHAAGETLYQARRSGYQAAEDERQQNLKQAEQICQQIEALAATADPGQQRSELSALKTDYQALGQLPRNAEKSIQKRYQHACTHFEKSVKAAQQQQWLARFDILIEAAKAWDAQELSNQQLEAAMIPSTLPERWQKAISKRCQTEINKTLETQARSICIDMEILADIDSPAEDKALRMDLQMQKLTAGLGQAQQQHLQESIEQGYLDWFSLPCWDQDQHSTLQQRFLQAVTACCKQL